MAICHESFRESWNRPVQVGREITVTHIKKPMAHHDWKRIVIMDSGNIVLCTEVHAGVDVSKVVHEFDKLRKPCEKCGR